MRKRIIACIVILAVMLLGNLSFARTESVNVVSVAIADLTNSVLLNTLTPSATDKYTGNLGDSFISDLGTRNGNIDIYDNTYSYGLEGWVARWNFRNELSWVWNEYHLDGQYSTLSGLVTILKSYNITNFQTQLDIIGDGNNLYSITLTPSTQPTTINISVKNVNVLRIYLHDIVAATGGTSFGLIDFAFDADGLIRESTPAKTATFGGHTYAIFDNDLLWTDAESLCESQGGHLVTITTQGEQDFIKNLLSDANKNNYWIGATNEGTGVWRWVTGEAFSYTNWGSGEPNNQEGSEQFVHIYAKPHLLKIIGDWNDASNNGAPYAGSFYNLENYGFICEWDSEDTLAVNPNFWVAPIGGGSQSIAVTSDTDWICTSSDPTWLTASRSGNSMTLTATALSGATLRSGQVTVTTGTLSQVVKVAQTNYNPNTGPDGPIMVTDSPTYISVTDVTLNGILAAVPAGGADVYYYGFEYGSSPTLNAAASITVGNSTSPTYYSTRITDRAPDTTYYYRAFAYLSGSSGEKVYGNTVRFVTTEDLIIIDPSATVFAFANETIPLKAISNTATSVSVTKPVATSFYDDELVVLSWINTLTKSGNTFSGEWTPNKDDIYDAEGIFKRLEFTTDTSPFFRRFVDYAILLGKDKAAYQNAQPSLDWTSQTFTPFLAPCTRTYNCTAYSVDVTDRWIDSFHNNGPIWYKNDKERSIESVTNFMLKEKGKDSEGEDFDFTLREGTEYNKKCDFDQYPVVIYYDEYHFAKVKAWNPDGTPKVIESKWGPWELVRSIGYDVFKDGNSYGEAVSFYK